MGSHKRDNFLDLDSDDEDGDKGYDSEEQDIKAKAVNSKQPTENRSSKRRKISGDDSDADESESDADINRGKERSSSTTLPEALAQAQGKAAVAADVLAEGHLELQSQKPPKKGPLTLTEKEKERAKKRKNKTGVIYLSSLPPYLKPSALKTMLLQRGFGPITRIFLTPADLPPGAASKKNRRKLYADGWVEFASKRTAKICAEALNASIVGGKKGGWYHDDIWNMKYLRGFKWDDLMEQIQRERGEREARRRIEDSRARKEEKVFLAGVEKGKAVEGIKKKRETKGVEVEPDVRRMFRQNKVVTETGEHSAEDGSNQKELDVNAQRVLSKIF